MPYKAYSSFYGGCFLAISATTVAQVSVAAAPNKLNVLYIGVDNPVTVAASGGTDDKVTVVIKGGGATMSKIGTGLYNVRVNAVTDDCLLNVYVSGKLAGTTSFRVRKSPAPMGIVGIYDSGEKITADGFKNQKGLGIYTKDFPFEIKYEVVGYTFSIDTDKDGIKTANCEGAYFCAEARQYIDQYVKPGATVLIENIRVRDPGGRELKLPSLVYYIK